MRYGSTPTKKSPKPSLLERLRQKRAQRLVTGVCWYTEEEWRRVKADAVDPERFEATYAEWEAMAEAALRDIRKAGVHSRKVLVRADDLVAWCCKHGRRNDAESRAEFVVELLKEGDS